MQEIVILVVATVPALLLVRWFWGRDQDRVSASLVWEAFFVGACSGIPVVAAVKLAKLDFSYGYHPVAGALLEAFLTAGIPEELVKLIVIVVIMGRQIDRQFPHDFIVLGAAVSGGFAALENLGYILLSGNSFLVALTRALLSVPMHIFMGVILGSGLALRELGRDRIWLLSAIALPIAFHGIFDFPLMLAENPSTTPNAPWHYLANPRISMSVVLLAGAAAALLSAFVLRHDLRPTGRAASDETSASPQIMALEKWGWFLLGFVLLAGATFLIVGAILLGRTDLLHAKAILLLYGCGALHQGWTLRRFTRLRGEQFLSAE
jgi:RsiW-degrading membrane proteinase PrsW (M82 family)